MALNNAHDSGGDGVKPNELFIAGSYWVSHKNLDHFDSDKLIMALVSRNENGEALLWTSDLLPKFEEFKKYCNQTDQIEGRRPEDFFKTHHHGPRVKQMVRQAEALFNLSQLMFALYHGQHQASTFGDLNNPELTNANGNGQHRTHIRDMSENGFNKMTEAEKSSGAACRRALHDLCCDIFESAGLEVIFSMFKHDHLKIIKQKCLDALTNILCVPVIEEYVLKKQSWFLRDLINLIRFGKTNEKLQQDVVPSISVLDRLIVVILSNKFEDQYRIIMAENCIEACLDSLENGLEKNSRIDLEIKESFSILSFGPYFRSLN